jgi:lysozyme family protein
VNFAGIDPTTGKYVYAVSTLDDLTLRQVAGESQWAVQATLKYEF